MNIETNLHPSLSELHLEGQLFPHGAVRVVSVQEDVLQFSQLCCGKSCSVSALFLCVVENVAVKIYTHCLQWRLHLRVYIAPAVCRSVPYRAAETSLWQISLRHHTGCHLSIPALLLRQIHSII